MRIYICILVALLSLSYAPLFGQELPERALLRKGNKSFEKGEYEQAIENYLKALEHEPQSYEVRYNLGNALFKGGMSEQAVELLQPMAQDSLLSAEQRAELYYNLGNIAFEGEDLQGALESYKNSLRLNPSDMEAKYNYALTKRLLEQQEEQEQEQDGEDENEQDENEDNQDNQDDQQGEDEQNQDENQGDDEQNQDENQGDDEQNQDEQQSEQQQQPQNSMSEQQQQQILDAIQAQEDKTQEKLEHEEAQGVLIRGAKNW